MRRTSIVFLAASLLAPALLFSVGCSTSKIADDGGVLPADGAPLDFSDTFDLAPPSDGAPLDFSDTFDLAPPGDGFLIELDGGPIDGGWIDVDLGPAFVCGDGILTAPEQCDDGNTTAGDGCDAACNVEPSVCPGGAAPRTLASGATLSGDTSGVMSAASGTCGGGTSGENTFVFTLYEAADVTVTTDLRGTAYNAAVYVRSTCADRTTELGCASAAPAGDSLTLSGLAAGTYFAFVDGAGGASGAYAISLTVTPRIAIGGACDPMGATGTCVDGATCAPDATGTFACRSPASVCADSAVTLTLGAAATGGTTVGAEDLYAPSCSSDGAAPERVFSVVVPAGAHDLVVTATPTNFAADSFDVVLTVETACGDAGSALGCSDARAADATEEVVVQNAAGTYYVVADGYGTARGFTTGEFEVAARLRDVLALGAACDPAGVTDRCADGTSCLGGVCGALTTLTDTSPNGLFCDAQGPVTGDTLFNGTLTVGGTTDYDTVEVTLGAAASLAITTSDGAGGCIADTLVEVFDGAMSCTALDAAMPPPTPLASDDNSGIAMMCSSLTTAVLPAGTYYVRVRRSGFRTPGGAYQMFIDVI